MSPTAELLNDLVSEGAVVIQNATIFHDVTLDHSNVAIASSQCQQTVSASLAARPAAPAAPAAPYASWPSAEPSDSALPAVELPYAGDSAWLGF